MSYYSRYRDAILLYQQLYREENTDKIKEGKARYRAEPTNQEKENTYSKQHREENEQYLKEKIICDNCGRSISRNGIARHKESTKCMNHNK